MARIGSFGAKENAPEQDTVEVLGREFRVAPKESAEVASAWFMAHAKTIDADSDDPEEKSRGNGLVWEYVELLIHPGDWREFFKHVMANGYDMDDLMKISNSIVLREAVEQGRPTEQPSGSTDGLSATQERSEPEAMASVSPLVAAAKLVDPAVLEHYRDRPDLQLGVLQMAADREAARSA